MLRFSNGTECLRRLVETLRHQDSAATAIEYAMVAFLVSIAGFVLVQQYRDRGGRTLSERLEFILTRPAAPAWHR